MQSQPQNTYPRAVLSSPDAPSRHDAGGQPSDDQSVFQSLHTSSETDQFPPHLSAQYSAEGSSLAAAFAYFNHTSAQLTSTYYALEGRVKQLNRELDTASLEKEQACKAKSQIATRMQALLDFLPGGVIVLDAKGNVVEANPAAKQLLEHPLHGHVWRKVIGQCFSPRNDDGFEVSTRSGRRISIATSSLENNGQIILLTDQTETRKLQENLSHHEKLSAVGKMVSALAHQIRTPLSAAILYAGHLVNKKIDPQKKQIFAKKLQGRLHHLEKQVRDMMLFVKNELPLNEIISLTDLELGLREAAEIPISLSNGSCRWKNTHPTQQVKCNREALINAIMNLINNGIQAGNKQPKLHIECARVETEGKNTVRISVADNGVGMSAEQLATSQEMFVTTKPQGTGLGLSVVSSVARAHGGSFKLISNVGEGTLAVLTLPVLEKNSEL
ncbi:MAG: two-component system sensor histidine kinase FlrB [Lentisphaeria bacterium]